MIFFSSFMDVVDLIDFTDPCPPKGIIRREDTITMYFKLLRIYTQKIICYFTFSNFNRLLLSWECLCTNFMEMNWGKCLVMKNIHMDFIQWLVYPLLPHNTFHGQIFIALSFMIGCYRLTVCCQLVSKRNYMWWQLHYISLFCSSSHYFGGFALWLLHSDNMWPKDQWTPLPCSCQTRND